MKKLTFALLVGIATLAISACGSYSYTTTPTVVGGYSEYRTVTTEDLSIYRRASKGTKYYNYTPLNVSTQIVNGTNYRFECQKKNGKHKEVHVYYPLPGKGDPRIEKPRHDKSHQPQPPKPNTINNEGKKRH